MKNYFRTTLWIATLTAASILAFQGVWVYRNYRTTKENFRIRTKEALQRSVDQYLLEEIPTPVSLDGPAPTLSILSTVAEEKKGQPSKPLNAPFAEASSVRIEFHPLQIDTANLESVKLFVAQMTALSDKQQIKMPVVEHYFQKELDKECLDVNFSLTLMKKPSAIQEGAIAVSLGRGEGDWVILATPSGQGRHLLSQNMVPALISLALILMSAGCLWYMGLIIARQRRLDQTKNDFIDNLAHELRTPVAILKSTNEALLNFGQASDTEKTNRYLQFNAGVLDKLEDGIDRLLRIRQYELGAKAASLSLVNVPELLGEVVGKFHLNQHDQVILDVKPDGRHITSDAAMLKDIAANLIDNALKYSKSPAMVKVSASASGKSWQLIVEDNGIGISEENLPMIFDKFYRVGTGDLHDVRGYGIGLSYVKQLVLQLKGEIKVQSELGTGTIFTITFPL